MKAKIQFFKKKKTRSQIVTSPPERNLLPAGEAAISLKNVNKSYGRTQILYNISLNIKKGEIFGILGPSGCGKTTVVKVISGMLPYHSGEVKILGENIPQFKILRRIGYMSQSDALYLDLTAKENLEFLGKIYGLKGKKLRNRIHATLEMVDLLPHINVEVKNFSGGMKRRLSLAGALLHNPELIILDEPTVGIDPLLRKQIWDELDKLAKSGVTIVMTTHVMDEADKCDRLAMMRSGKVIAQGSAQELIDAADVPNIEAAFIFYGGGGKNAGSCSDSKNHPTTET